MTPLLALLALNPAAVDCKYCKEKNTATAKECKYCFTSLDYANFPIPTPLAVTNEFDGFPCWGPGGKIAYINAEKGHNVWTMNADGTGKKMFDRGQESHKDADPNWGPNDKIVFSGGVADINILIMDADGSNRRVVGMPDSTEREPSIRKDGLIAFCSSKGQPGDEWFNIFTMDSEGGNVKKLTKDGTYNYDPCWSPDGSKIVYSVWADDEEDIYVMDADGSNVKRLTTAKGSDYEPSFAADGRIVFVSNRDATTTFKNQLGEIYIMGADGSNQKRLTWNRWVDRNPTMDAQGRLVFQSDPGYGPLKNRGVGAIGMIKVK